MGLFNNKKQEVQTLTVPAQHLPDPPKPLLANKAPIPEPPKFDSSQTAVQEPELQEDTVTFEEMLMAIHNITKVTNHNQVLISGQIDALHQEITILTNKVMRLQEDLAEAVRSEESAGKSSKR